jgi:hypothetical protein
MTAREPVVLPVIRIEPERDGAGWIIVTPRGHAWLFGDRSAALSEKRWHDQQWGRA